MMSCGSRLDEERYFISGGGQKKTNVSGLGLLDDMASRENKMVSAPTQSTTAARLFGVRSFPCDAIMADGADAIDNGD